MSGSSPLSFWIAHLAQPSPADGSTGSSSSRMPLGVSSVTASGTAPVSRYRVAAIAAPAAHEPVV